MTLDRPNLANAFSKPRTDRAAGLTGLLPTPRPQRAEPTPAATTNDDVITANKNPSTANTATAVAPRQRPSTEKQRISDEADITANVAIYIEPDLLKLVRERRRLAEISYDELISDAFADVTDDELARIFQPDSGTSTSGMPRRQRRVRGTAGIQVQVRLDTNQRAWLEEKKRAVSAPSRSALVAAALRLHLLKPIPPHTDTSPRQDSNQA